MKRYAQYCLFVVMLLLCSAKLFAQNSFMNGNDSVATNYDTTQEKFSLTVKSTGAKNVSIGQLINYSDTRPSVAGKTDYTKHDTFSRYVLIAPPNHGNSILIKWDGCDFYDTRYLGTCVVDMYSNRTVTVHYTEAPWESEIGIINYSSSDVLLGRLRAFDSSGSQIWYDDVFLNPFGRHEVNVAQSTGDQLGKVRYMRFDIILGQAVGYQKNFKLGQFRAATEASPRSDRDNLFIPHIASNDIWWTGFGMINTSDTSKNLLVSFNTGESANISLSPGQHTSTSISSIFNHTKKPDIKYANVCETRGIAGTMFFGTDTALAGLSLSDSTSKNFIFPHLAITDDWWTGYGIFNPGMQTAYLNLYYYDKKGRQVKEPTTAEIGSGEKKVALMSSSLHDVDYIKVTSTEPITAFELFGSPDGSQAAGFSLINLDTYSGIFPKHEHDGWTGIAFVNNGENTANLTLRAISNNGSTMYFTTYRLDPKEKIVGVPSSLFSHSHFDYEPPDYYRFDSDQPIVGFQLNGSLDGTMLDALPALGLNEHVGQNVLYFPHSAITRTAPKY